MGFGSSFVFLKTTLSEIEKEGKKKVVWWTRGDSNPILPALTGNWQPSHLRGPTCDVVLSKLYNQSKKNRSERSPPLKRASEPLTAQQPQQHPSGHRTMLQRGQTVASRRSEPAVVFLRADASRSSLAIAMRASCPVYFWSLRP